MESNETQLQKAIIIAVKDGFEKLNEKQFYRKDSHYLSPANLYTLYTTDLNYLMPIAVKVIKSMGQMRDSKDNLDVYNAYCALYESYYELKLDENCQYTELFNACYEAVKLLEA